MSRLPFPLSFPRVKAPGRIRVFVFGESAAFGDPQPRFGFPHMLEAILNLRFPGVKFEVINAAMTAINSNAVLPIARDCAQAGGDIWVVYLGNNEVVGPFGGGTVFGPQTPPLWVIRSTLALEKTRTGQLFDALRQWFTKPPPSKSEWGGMEMFLGQQVREDNPRMQSVYAHFGRNLADIIRAGRRSGAGIVVSTVAVNLKDCAPFASSFRPGLPDAAQARWKATYAQAIEEQNSGRFEQALAQFSRAAAIDDSVAELRFRRGQCELALHRFDDAKREFEAARDLDTLRFRCDTRLNQIIRKTAGDREKDRVLLADAQSAFAEHSANGLPGDDLFYEHVHLTLAGNYLLARTLAPEIEKLLPKSVHANAPWPTIEQCARRLAWCDWSRERVLTDILTRLGDPPFTGQLNHEEQVERFKRLLIKLGPADSPQGVSNALTICKAALAEAPQDQFLYSQLALLQSQAGDLAGATASAQRAIDLLPTSADAWSELGFVYVNAKRFAEAADAFRHAFDLDPNDVWPLQNLAQSLLKLGKRQEAIREYRRAVAIVPRFGMAWLGLGQALELEGRKAEAEECYQKALANRIHRAQEMTTLARFCRSRGWMVAAATNYLDAIEMNPSDLSLRLEAGESLAACGRHDQALRQFSEAATLAPDSGQAHYLYGVALGRAGRSSEAVTQFRDAVRLMPEVVEARLNLGIALMHAGNRAEAAAEFQNVLDQSPTNPVARRYLDELAAENRAAHAP